MCSFKNSALLIHVRKVDQIQKLAARRQSLRRDVIEFVQRISEKIQQDFADEKLGISPKNLMSPENLYNLVVEYKDDDGSVSGTKPNINIECR